MSRSSPDKIKPLAELFRSKNVMDVIGIGNREPNPPDKAIMPFGTHFVEVEVNTRTGEVRVVRFTAANESGRVINRHTFDSQVYGGMTMGLGYAMTEKRVLDRQTGKMVNVNFFHSNLSTVFAILKSAPIL